MNDFTNGPAPSFFRLLLTRGSAVFPMLAICTFVASLGSAYHLFRADQLARDGVDVSATVIHRQVRRSDDTTRHFVEFSYVTRDGVETMERRVSRSTYDRMPVGHRFRIRYLPDAPNVIEFKDGERWYSGVFFHVLALLFGTLFLLALWLIGRSVVDAILARRFGRGGIGRVVDVAERHGFPKGYVMRWRSEDGSLGESLPSASYSRYVRAGIGKDIEYYVSPRGRMWWVGDVGPRAAAPTVPDAGKPAS